ncbi:FHA domain-containing protein [Piscinibacter sp.]|uniref:FHA domain-containing protein n=1 Tax=Piscinibacter sp. TaxID=1903157 RepID=UPI0039E3FF42
MGEEEVNAPLAIVEVLDRDGQVRHAQRVPSWPLSIGRALDNELSLGDPYLAPHHCVIELDANGLGLRVLDSANGVQIAGARHLRAGEREALADGEHAVEISAGRTRLRLRRPGDALAPELPLAASATLLRRGAPVLAAGAGLALALAFETWLASDPDVFLRTLGTTALTTVMGAAVWIGLWALLSKLFTRQTHAGWHLRVFLFSSLAWMVVGALPGVIAFALSWPWVSDFGFIAGYAIGAAALYYHLLGVEPSRPRLMRGVAVTAFVLGTALTLWKQEQRNERLGAELYLSSFQPPALRLARPVPADRFAAELAALQPLLDKKAKEENATENGASDDE